MCWRIGNIWIASDQDGAYRFDPKVGAASLAHFTTKDGLAHQRNVCLYEDRAGRIWIGGQGGVSRYDPSVVLKSGQAPFVTLTTKEGLTHNNVSCILEDRTGRFWFGTRGTACVYDGKIFTEIKNDKGDPFVNVWSIIEDRKGHIWLGDPAGLWRYDGDSYTNVSKQGGMGLYEDKEGNIWTVGGTEKPSAYVFYRHDALSLLQEVLTATPVFKRPSSEGSSDGMVFCVTADKNGAIWFGTLFGVGRYDGRSVTYFKDPAVRE